MRASTTTASIGSSPGVSAHSEPWGSRCRRRARRRRLSAARRAAQAALALESAEPEFRFDARATCAAIARAQTESHRLIEHLMIAANEQVAELLERGACRPCIASTSAPTATAVERLIEQLASLGVPTPPMPGGHLTPQQAAEVVGEASQLVERLGGRAAARARGR